MQPDPDPTEWHTPDETSVGSQIDEHGALTPCIRFRTGETWLGFRFTETEFLRFCDELFELARPIHDRHRGPADDDAI